MASRPAYISSQVLGIDLLLLLLLKASSQSKVDILFQIGCSFNTFLKGKKAWFNFPPMSSSDSSSYSSSDGSTESSVSESDNEYIVEDIVDKKWDRRTQCWLYCIKWKGWPSSDNTWEPRKNLKCREKLLQFEAMWKSQHRDRGGRDRGANQKRKKSTSRPSSGESSWEPEERGQMRKSSSKLLAKKTKSSTKPVKTAHIDSDSSSLSDDDLEAPPHSNRTYKCSKETSRLREASSANCESCRHEKELKSLKVAFNKLKHQSIERVSEIDSLNQQLKESKEAHDSALKEIKNLKKSLESARRNIVDLTQSSEELKKQLEQAEEKHEREIKDSIKAMNDRMEIVIKDYQRMIAEKENELKANHEMEIAQLTQQLQKQQIGGVGSNQVEINQKSIMKPLFNKFTKLLEDQMSVLKKYSPTPLEPTPVLDESPCPTEKKDE